MIGFKSLRLAAAWAVGLLSVPLTLGLIARPAHAEWAAIWNNINVSMVAAVRTACPRPGPTGGAINYGNPQVYIIRPHTSGAWLTPSGCLDKILDTVHVGGGTGLWQMAVAFFADDGSLNVGILPVPRVPPGVRLSQGWFIPVNGFNDMNIVGAGSWEACGAVAYCFRSGDKMSWNQEMAPFVTFPWAEQGLQQAREYLSQAIESPMVDQVFAQLRVIEAEMAAQHSALYNGGNDTPYKPNIPSGIFGESQ